MVFVVGTGGKRRLTALLDCRAFLGELDEYDVAEAFLRIVRDGHRPNSTLVVKRDQLVIWRVSFRWRSSGKSIRFFFWSPRRTH